MGLPALVTLFSVILLLIPAALTDRQFIVNNNCNISIWPAVYTNNLATGGNTYTGTTGWEASAHSSRSFTIPEGWSGRVWARQGCSFSSGKGSCLVGDCNGVLECTVAGTGSTTILEWAISSAVAADIYDISLLDGFNLPVEMKTNNACPSVSCLTNFNTGCPSALVGQKQDDTVLSCNNDQKHEDWFRTGCPQVYVTPYDVENVAFSNQTCPGGQAADYTVTFCPFGTVNATAPGTSSSTSSSSSSSSSISSSPSTSSTSPSSEATAASSSEPKRLSGGAIAGIVIGALCAVGLILFAVWFLLRRNRTKGELDEKNGSSGQVEPFMDGAYITPTPGAGVLTKGQAQPEETTPSPITLSPVRRRKNGESGPLQASSSSPVAAHPSPLSPPLEDSSTPLNLQQGGPSNNAERSENIDLDRIFEDRVHEDQLLAFIARRMDRNTRPEDDEGSLAPPPTYRPS